MNKKQSNPGKEPLASGGKIELKKSKDKKSIEKVKEEPIVQQKNEKDKPKKESKLKDDKKGQKDKKDKKDKGKPGKEKDKGQSIEEVEEKTGKKKKDKDSKKDKKDKKDKGKQLKKDKSDKKLKSLSDSKSDKQADTIKNIRNSQQRAKMTIQQLIEQYKGEAQKLLFHNRGHDSEKEQQIQKQLSKLQKQKEQRHKKMEELQKHKDQIQQSRIKQKQLKQQLKKQRQKQKKIESIRNKLQSIEQNASERKKEYAKFIQYVKQRKQFVPRFKRYEKSFEQQKEAENQHIQQTLMDIEKGFKPLNLKEIEKFEENYLSQKMESQRYRVSKIRLESEMINEQNKKLYQKIWRGKCHQVVQNQLEDFKIRKNADHQKEITRKEYGRLISQNISKEGEGQPEDGKEKAVEEQSETPSPQNVHIREKYIKGVNYGLITEVKKIPMSIEQKGELGKEYLSYVKQMNKSRKNKTIDNGSLLRKSKEGSAQQQSKNKSKVFKIRRKSNPYYPSQQGRKSLDFKNYESIQYTLEKIKAADIQRELQDKILRHGQHPDILAIQEKKRKLGAIVVKEINDKLQLLSKL